MKRYFIRAGQTPFNEFGYRGVIARNAIGNNSGNLLYAQSVFRALMVDDDTEIIPNYYGYGANPTEISATCDAFIVPLADAFRPSYPELSRMTEFIKKLTIPTVVIGVGLRAPFDYEMGHHYAFDDEVKDFVRAVRNSGGMVGVRGELTSRYLTSIGFVEGEDHRVIGCPSMYTWGRELKVKDPDITYDSTVCINATATSNITRANDFIFSEARKFNDYYFLPQLIDEYRLAYAGVRYGHKKCGYYPDSILSKEYAEDRVRIFADAQSWAKFTSRMDFSFGGRLHGNIGAILGGTPGLLFTKDARTRELADYHQLPSMPETEIPEGASILDLVEKADFDSYKKVQGENFDRFTKFLEDNGLEHIYQRGYERGEAPFDKIAASLEERSLENYAAQLCDGIDLSARMKDVIYRAEPNARRMEHAVKASKKSGLYSDAQIDTADKILETGRKWKAARSEMDAFVKKYHESIKHQTVTAEQVEEMGSKAREQMKCKATIAKEFEKIRKPSEKYYDAVKFGSKVKNKMKRLLKLK